MSTRTAIIGPFQKIKADVIGKAVNVAPFLENLQRLDVHRLWYSTTIQSGVEALEVVGEPEKEDHWPQFLAKRVSYSTPPEFVQSFALVMLAFENHFGLAPGDKLEAPVSELQNFLVELLLAAHRKRNLIYFDEMPDVTSLQSLLPTDLFLPFKNLILAVEHSTPVVASVQSALALQDIALFEELIDSKSFVDYENSHSGFDRNEVDLKKALECVRAGSRLLVAENPRLLKSRQVAISLLPVTSKLVDLVFGKLPGTLADFFTNALRTWLQDKRRIVIYQFSDLLEATMKARMNDLMRAKPKKASHPLPE
jgi:hypothetical protein